MGDPGSVPAGVQILSISCSFWENLKKSYVGAPWRVGTPISGKSWIRHWISPVMSTYYLANVFPKTVWIIFFMTCFHRAGGPLGPPLRIRYWDMKENRPRQWRIQDFPERGRQLSGGRGWAPTYDFAKFSQKLHEIERIWTPGWRASKILLCRSATARLTSQESPWMIFWWRYEEFYVIATAFTLHSHST